MAVAQINLAGNKLCGVYRGGSGDVRGTYTAEGIKAIADSIAVTASLTSIDLYNNNLGAEGAKALAPALRDSPSVTSVRASEIVGVVEVDGASAHCPVRVV